MKNLRTILLLFLANTISSIAQGISMLAIPWYFVQRGESQLLLIIYTFITFTSLFWGPVAGTFVDKYSRKSLFLYLTAIIGTIVFSIAAYGFYNDGLHWTLVATVFAATFFNYNLHYPNLYAFLQEITEPKYYGKITSYVEIQGQVSSMLAGVVGALLLEGATDGILSIGGFQVQLPFVIEPWALHEIFLADAATYVVAFLLISLLKYTSLTERVPETGNIGQRFRLGWNYLQSNAKIFVFGMASYVLFAAMLIAGFSLYALYIDAHLQAEGDVYASGYLYYAIGAILAGMLINRIFKSRIKGVILLNFGAAAMFLTLASTNHVWIYFMMEVVLGLTNAGIRVLRVTYLFENVPNQFYGRANGIFYVGNVLLRLFFLGLFILPFFHEGNNVIWALVIFTVCLVIAGIVMIWNEQRIITN